MDVGCVMITGAGNAFCSGGDVSEMGDNSKPKGNPPTVEEQIANLTEKQRTLTGVLYHLKKPTIAALPGAAAGAGLSIALACDLRIACEDAFMVTAFRNVGLSGDYGCELVFAKAGWTGESKGADLPITTLKCGRGHGYRSG